MIRTLFLFTALSGAAMIAHAAEKQVHECKIPDNPAKTDKGAFIGIYYIDGKAQPGYCTAKTKDGWKTESAAMARPDPRKFTAGDQVCPNGGRFGLPRPGSSPGPTVPCVPTDKWLSSTGAARTTTGSGAIKSAN